MNVGPGCPNLIERIESGLLSFGNDMDYRHSPLQCGLRKYCHFDQDIESLSLEALREQDRQGVPSRLVGLMAIGQNEMPEEKAVYLKDNKIGDVFSDCISPRHGAYLAVAMLDSEAIDSVMANEGQGLSINMADQTLEVKCMEIPFKFD